MLVCSWKLSALYCFLTCLFSLQMKQGQVNWKRGKRGKSVTALEIQSILPSISNFGVEKITWSNLQLEFLYNDAFPPQLLHRTCTFHRNLKIKHISQSSSSVVVTCFDRLIKTNTESTKRQ